MNCKKRDIVVFTLTGQKAMVLEVHAKTPDSTIGNPVDGYLIRLDDLREVFVRDFEITLIEEYKDA